MTAGQVPAYSYVPGDWTVLVRGSILAALPAGTDPAIIAAVWDAMDDDVGTAPLLPLVIGGAGAESAAMPSFALASTAGRLQVILRGHVTLTVAGSTGSATYSGERAVTWAEHLIEDAFSSFTLTCGPVTGTESSLPLVGGAVLAGSIRATPAGSGAGAPARAAADAGLQQARATRSDRGAGSATLPAVPLAEPGGVGMMDPELEAEPSPAVGEQLTAPPAHAAADPADGDDDAATGPGLVVTSVPADVADPSVASAVEPLAPETSAPDIEPQKEGRPTHGRSTE